ncbi:SANT/Myb domain-containing protein [Cinnamomum micranthum f. kanehirae]|uniref:SANT/Myb domain-containing protein n=1 Tax=Cinnamomum micranthum f. kanehirae TaxID=337451 RepID=A0A3S4NGM2_9MAGN|nr:SANT/Myb domain-containing protein [Cinnamomum micranthum f. kanehirae]
MKAGITLIRELLILMCLPSVRLYGEPDSALSTLIFASNKELAREASEVFDNILPSNQPQSDTGETASNIFCRKSGLHIQEKLSMHKHFQKFKEWVLTYKFRAFHHLWKEDMRLLSLKNNRVKSQKRFELSCRSSHSTYQKHRSSIHSRYTSPGNSTLVPTTRIANFTSSKLLSDSQIKRYRNHLKMPALMILEEQRHSRFITKNGLVEDPCAVEKERKLINSWLPDEKEIFMEKLATFGKDFRKIASFLSHKTTADCIEFYYKNHKSESFEVVKKRFEFRKQPKSFPTNTYMVTSGKKWNRDANAVPLDMLGAASTVASHTDDRETQKVYTGASIVGCHSYDRKASIVNGVLERTGSEGVRRNESDAAAADVLASISVEAVGSYIVSSVDPGDGWQEFTGKQAKSMVMERPFTPGVSEKIDEGDAFSDDSCGELDSADWTDEEKSSFIMALRTYGKDFARISKFVRTRTRDQCKIFFSKGRKCLGLDLIHREPGNEGIRMSDTSGGRSDTEDNCIVDIDSAICSTQSCSKLDTDLPLAVRNGCGGSGNAEKNLMKVELDALSEKDEVGGTNLEAGTGMKELDTGVHHFGDMGELVFDSDNRSLKEDHDQSGSVPGVLQLDGVMTADAVLGCSNPSVSLLDYEAGSFVEADKKVQRSGLASSYVQANCVSTEVPQELDQSTSFVVVEPTQEEQSQCKPFVGVEAMQETKTVSSDGLLNPKSKPLQFQVAEIVPATGLADARVPERVVVDGNSCNTSARDVPHSNGNGNSSLREVEVNAHSSATSVPGHQHQMSLELLTYAQKSQVFSWQLKDNCPSGLVNSPEAHHYDHLCQATQSVPDHEVQGNKLRMASESSDFYQQNLPLQVFRGNPLRVQNKKEMNKHADMTSEKPVQKLSKINRDCQVSQSNMLEKCDVSTSSVSVSGLSYVPKSNDRSEDLQRSSSQGMDTQVMGGYETEEQSLRTGDVKLFGQILSHLSPSNKEKNDKAVSSKPSQSFSFKLAEHVPHGTTIGSKIEASSYMGRQEFPVTSFGVWDVNRMHNGFPSSPGSAMLSAIHNYPVPTCQTEPRPLSAVLMRNDGVLGRVLGYPTKDASGNVGLDGHQLYQTYEGTNVKPFSMDMKRQEHNGFEMLGFQQQGGTLVGLNSIGGVGVGSCTSVSDPVAALKKHFANVSRSGNGPACVIREEEPWSGDVCR